MSLDYAHRLDLEGRALAWLVGKAEATACAVLGHEPSDPQHHWCMWCGKPLETDKPARGRANRTHGVRWKAEAAAEAAAETVLAGRAPKRRKRRGRHGTWR